MEKNKVLFLGVFASAVWVGAVTLFNPQIAMTLNNSFLAGIFLLLYLKVASEI